MQEVKIYDFDFNLIASDFKCVSFEWDVRFNSVGTFEGVFTSDSPVYNACRQNEFAVCVQGENQGIVTSVNIKDDRIVVSGKSMNYILEKRICLPFTTKDEGVVKSAFQVVHDIVRKYCGDFITMSEIPDGVANNHFTRIEPKSVEEVISDILSGVNGGHYVEFDVENKRWVFGIRVTEEKGLMLSEPDRTLSDCDYVRYVTDYASGGVYEQKPYFMGEWQAKNNYPYLENGKRDNFAKVYKVVQEGSNLGYYFYEGEYVVCKSEAGIWEKAESYGPFWYEVNAKNKSGAKNWHKLLFCDDITEAVEMADLSGVDENVIAVVRGINSGEFKIGDTVKIQLKSGDGIKVFKKQIKRITYHYEWGNCFVRPTFYKLKEREDE